MSSIETKLEENTKGEVDNVRVAVRSRPLSVEEEIAGHFSVIQVDEVNGEISISDKHLKHRTTRRGFTFDTVFGPNSKQLDIYNETARPIVNSVLEGYNGTIFAYGQTGTGKTFTMEGDRNVSELQGIIPNSFAHIFGHISKAEGEIQFLVRVSYLEIYNEQVRDLLGKENGKVPKIHQRPDIGVYVKDLISCVVRTPDDMDKVMTTGNRNRAVAKTDMNLRSSRSHAIFTITIERSDLGTDNKQHVRMGKLHLVDLAGSERVDKTGVTGDQFKEATNINLSLTTLGNVISALVDGKSTHIPYRNSNLTRLLQDSLGGNSKTVMIANIGPANYNIEETVNTLRYANRAKRIQNHARINEDPKDALLREFQLEIAKLKKRLEEGSSSEIEGLDESSDTPKRKKKLKRKVSDTILTLENELENEKQAFSMKKDMAEEEKRFAMEELALKESELAKAKREEKDLEERLADLQGKVIVGGVNLLDKAEKQEKLLEQSAKELKKRKEREANLKKKLEKTQAEKLDIEEKYASLQEESEGKTKNLKKLWNMLLYTKQELSDLKNENQQEINELTDNVKLVDRELRLTNLLLSFYVPDESMQLIAENSTWNESIGEWEIRNLSLAGNNIPRESTTPDIDYDEVYGNDISGVYLSYPEEYRVPKGDKNKGKVSKSTSKEGKRKKKDRTKDTEEFPVSKSASVVRTHYA